MEPEEIIRMPESYRVLRVHANLTNLEVEVNRFLADGWQATGAPFYDEMGGQWCQAMTKQGDASKPGQVKLREPRR